MELLAFVGIGGAAVATVIVYAMSNSRHAREARAERCRYLDSAASRHGGVVEGHTRLAFADGELAFQITLELQEQRTIATMWSVRMPPPGLTPFTVAPASLASVVSELIGGEDLEVGVSAEFDRRFVVRAAVPVDVRRVWTVERCATMTSRYRDGKLTCTGAQLALIGPAPLAAADLDVGLDLLRGLARVDLFGLTVLRALPDAGPRVDGEFGVVLAGPGSIRIGPCRLPDGRYVTRARAHVDGAPPLPAIVIADGEVAAEALALVPGHLHAQTRALGTAQLEVIGHEAVVSWPHVEEAPPRLIAAIELLRGLATSPSLGVFR